MAVGGAGADMEEVGEDTADTVVMEVGADGEDIADPMVDGEDIMDGKLILQLLFKTITPEVLNKVLLFVSFKFLF